MTEHTQWAARLDAAERRLAELQHELDRKDAAFSKQTAPTKSPKSGVGSQKLSMAQTEVQEPVISSISITPTKAAAMHRVVTPRKVPSTHQAAATLAAAAASHAADASLNAMKAAAAAQATAVRAANLTATAQLLSPTKVSQNITSFPIQNFDSTTSSSLNSTIQAFCPSVDDVVIHEKQEQMEAALNKAKQLGCMLHSRDNDLKAQLNRAVAGQIAAQAVAKAKDDLLQARQQELAMVKADCFRLVEEVQNLRIENKTLIEEKAEMQGQLVNQQQLETELAIMKAEVASLTAELVKTEDLSLVGRPLCPRCECKLHTATHCMGIHNSPGWGGCQHSATIQSTQLRTSRDVPQVGGRTFAGRQQANPRLQCDNVHLAAAATGGDVSAQQCEQVLKATQKLQDALVSTTDSMAVLRERSKAAESSLAAQDLLIQQLRADDYTLREQLRCALRDLAIIQSSAAVHGVQSPSQSPHAQRQQRHNVSAATGATSMSTYPTGVQQVTNPPSGNTLHTHPVGLHQVNTSQPTLLSPFTLPPDLSVATSAYQSQNGHGVCVVGAAPAYHKPVSKPDIAALQRYQQALADLQAAQKELLASKVGAVNVAMTSPVAATAGIPTRHPPVSDTFPVQPDVVTQQGPTNTQVQAAASPPNPDKTYLAEVSAQLAAKTTELARHRADLLSAAQMMEDSQALQAQLAEQLQRTTEELNRVTVLVQTQQPGVEATQPHINACHTNASHQQPPTNSAIIRGIGSNDGSTSPDQQQQMHSTVRHHADPLASSEIEVAAQRTSRADSEQSRQQQDSMSQYYDARNTAVGSNISSGNNNIDPLGLSMLATRTGLQSPAQRQLHFPSNTEANRTAMATDVGTANNKTFPTEGHVIPTHPLHVPGSVSLQTSTHPSLPAQDTSKHSSTGAVRSATDAQKRNNNPSAAVAARTNHGVNTDSSEVHEGDMRALLEHLDEELAALAGGVADREAVTTSLLSRMAAVRKMLGKQPQDSAQVPNASVQSPSNASNTAGPQQAAGTSRNNAASAPMQESAAPLSPMQSAASKRYTVGGISIAPPSSVCSPTHGRYMGGSHRQWSQASMQFYDSDGGTDPHQAFSRFESNASKDTVIHHVPGESYSTYTAPSVATTTSDKETSDKGHGVGGGQTQVQRVLSNAADAVKAASAARAAKPHLMRVDSDARQESFGKVAGPSRMSPRATSRGQHSAKPYLMPSATSKTLEGGSEAELAERMAGLDQALKALVSDS